MIKEHGYENLQGKRAYLQSIYSAITANSAEETENLTCGDGAFICNERHVQLNASTLLRALLIDLS